VPIAGAAFVGAGAYLLATADDHPVTVEGDAAETEITRGGALGGGAGSLIIGVGMLGFSLGHEIRVARPDRTTEQLEERGEVVAPDVACEAAPAASQRAIVLDLPGGVVALGTTDARGRRSVDLLTYLLPSSVHGRDLRLSAPLLVAGSNIGAVDLRPVHDHFDARAWADAEPLRCAAPRHRDDCQGVERYLVAFPRGGHADEAQTVLASAQSTLAAMAAREEAARLAEAEARRAEQEARAAEYERLRLEAERERRLEEERIRLADERAAREVERAEREYRETLRAEARAREAAERAERARRQCRTTCRRTCQANDACAAACVRQQCE
jgi:hypothetical protein